MSEEGTQTVNTADDSTNVETVEATNVKNQVEETNVPQVDTTHERLLNESKKNKKRALEAEKRLEALEKSKLEEQGKYKELYEQYKTQFDELKNQTMRDKVGFEVKQHAAKAGCVDVNSLLKLGNGELMQFDEQTGEILGADLFIEDARKQFPFLFKSQPTPTINPVTPSGAPVKQTKTASQVAKSPEGFKAALAGVMKQ